MKRIIRILVFILLFSNAGLSQNTFGMPDTLTRRPKIGLVLSGGGARGMAHVAVLKALEKAGIRPDYITGTSMGSIVGGLYAIGFSADSIEQILHEQDWDKILSNTQTLRQINMEEKPEYDNYIVELPIRKWKPTLPSGVIVGHELQLTLNKYTISAIQYKDFDHFPIPFRCVSVDLITGEPYIFKNGNLATAMRASMAIPTVMEPVEFEDKLLVDGGLLINYPVLTAKDMGADIIIGCYTGYHVKKKKELNSIVSILKQYSFMPSVKNAKIQRNYVDINIEPDLEAFSPANFELVDSMIERGHQAVMKKWGELMELADYLKKFPPQKKKQVDLIDKTFVSKLDIKGTFDKGTEKFIRKIADVYRPRIVSDKEIRATIEKLYSTNLFTKINYAFVQDSVDGLTKLQFITTKKDKELFRAAIHYSGDNGIGIIANTVLYDFLFPGGKLELKANISPNWAFKARYFTYIGKRKNLGLSASYTYLYNDIPQYNESIEQISEIRVLNSTFNATFAVFLGRNTEFTIKFGHENIRYEGSNINTGKSFFTVSGNHYLDGKFHVNRLVEKYFSPSGATFDLGVRTYFNTGKNINHQNIDSLTAPALFRFAPGDTRLIGYLNYFKIFGKKRRVNFLFNFHTLITFISDGSYQNPIFIGGTADADPYTFAAPEVKKGAIFGLHYLYFKLGIRVRLFKNIFLTPHYSFAITTPEYLDAYNGDVQGFNALGIEFGYKSVIGPLKLLIAQNGLQQQALTTVSFGYSF